MKKEVEQTIFYPHFVVLNRLRDAHSDQVCAAQHKSPASADRANSKRNLRL